MTAKIGPYRNATAVLVKTITNLHIGIGQSVGVADLPVSRDSFGFPNIPASGMKGALRAHVQKSCKDCARAIFGPHPIEGETFAGAIAILDALLLTFPVRSLRGVYCHATCPLLLERADSYLELFNFVESKNLDVIKELLKVKPEDSMAYAPKETIDSLELENSAIFNEEYKLKLEKNDKINDKIAELSRVLGLDRLAIVSDNIARALIERSLIRNYRVRLNEKKTVESGGLWSEEAVPRGTTFITLFLYSDLRAPRKCNDMQSKESSDVKGRIEKLCFDENKGYLIFGGNETVGHGLVRLFKLGDQDGG